jgi:hypothetical protein
MEIDPLHFAAEWAAAWNAHDIEAVLRHFHEDASFSSPFAGLVLPGSGGRLVGKPAIRHYWAIGIARIPDLRFTIDAVFVGVECLVIAYTNQKQARVCEVLKFAGRLVIEGHGTYAEGVANPTGARDG